MNFPQRIFAPLKRHVRLVTPTFCLLLILSGCPASQSGVDVNDDSSDGISLNSQNDVEKNQLLAAKPFCIAIAERNYNDAFDQLSVWAKKEFVSRQIVFSDNDSIDSQNPIELNREKFVELMQLYEDTTAVPVSIDEFFVETMNEEILAGGGNAFERMIAIGSMPDSTPANIRRSSVCGVIQCRNTKNDMIALREQNPSATDAELHADYELKSILKCVMVEEQGGLKVGYFELFCDSK